MAQVRHLVTPPGKQPVEFFAPEGANDGEVRQLASQALAQAYPSDSFVTPILDQSTRDAVYGKEQAPRKLTQDEILAQQGGLTSRDPTMRERATEGLTSVLSGLGFSEGREKAGRLADDVFDWTPAAALESGEEVIRDIGGGRYLDAAGNAIMAGLDIIPELKGGTAALAALLGSRRLYHGGPGLVGDLRAPLFTSEDRAVAETYAKDRAYPGEGKVDAFDFTGEKLATDDDVMSVVREMGLLDEDEAFPAHMYITPGADPEAENVIAALRERGFHGAKLTDYSMDDPFTEIESIAVFDPSYLKPLSLDPPGTVPAANALEAFAPSKAAMKTAKQLSTMAGSPAGANKKASTRQVKKLSEDYLRQVDQGKGGADWYEKSGRSIMYHLGENEPMSVKFTGGVGVTSANTPVVPNLEHAVRGHMQAMAGDPIKTGLFSNNMGKDVQRVYDAPDMTIQELRDLGDASPYGKKRSPFIQQNLMYEGFAPGQQSTARAVHDIWDMRARGYLGKDGKPFSGSPGLARHNWADLQDQGYLIPEANARQIGGRTDWDTGRLQAAAWVGNKIDALMRDGKTFEEAQKIAMTDYSDAWSRLYANHSWESAPGSNTGHMAGFDDLPWEEKQRYHADVQTAFLNPEGQSRIALGYGMPTGQSYDTAGLYEGVVSPGTQDQIAVAREIGGQGIEASSGKMMNALAATQGLLGAQKGAAWNFQSPTKSTLKGATAFRFPMGRTLSIEDIEQYGPRKHSRRATSACCRIRRA
jgi:hypothetical protein